MLFTSSRIIISSLLFVTSLCFAQDSLWIEKKEIPTPRWHLSSVVVDGKIYALGGVNGYNSIEEYNPETDEWTVKESVPTGRSFIGKGAVDGKIYVIGGSILNKPALTAVEMLDPDSNTWKEKTPLPSARQGAGSCVVDGKIYIIGGNNPSVGTVEMYDPATDEWTDNLKAMPTKRWEPECVAVDGKIYAIGGFLSPTNGTGSDDVEMYNPHTDEWTIKASLPGKRGGGTVVYVNGYIYYFGGSASFSSPLKNVWTYDPTLNKWYVLPEMPFGWYLMTASVVNGRIYLMGGSKVVWPHNDNFKGVYEYHPPDPIAVSVQDEDLGYNQPFDFSLDQNYPNPFNPTTAIGYRLSAISNVELNIYNLIGQKIATLVNEKQQAGSYKIEWNASGMAGGFYYSELVAGQYRQVKKMVLIK